MATTKVTAPVGSWQKVSTALQNVLISCQSGGFLVHVGTVDPALSSDYHSCSRDQPFSMAGVSGQNVYIRSATDNPLNVSVTAV